MSYIATTVRIDDPGTGLGGASKNGVETYFSKNEAPYKVYNYPDVLDYEGNNDHNALDRQSVRELKLMPCVATKMLLRDNKEVDPPEITIHGRRIEIDNEHGKLQEEDEDDSLPSHKRTQSTRQPRVQLKYHQRSTSLPVTLEQGVETSGGYNKKAILDARRKAAQRKHKAAAGGGK